MSKKTPSKLPKISLKVLEAYTRDVGRAVARIDYDSMDVLNVSTGDVLEIKGKKRTVAKCLPLYPSDEGKGMIRLDGLGRTNSEIAIGDKISIRKIKAVFAQKITVRSLEAIPPIDERYLADALESVPVMNGDNVMVPYFGGRLTFQVTKTIPSDAVTVTRKTIFDIVDSPKTPETKVSNFFDVLKEFYYQEHDSLKKCREDKIFFNVMVGKLLTKTRGVISSSTAGKFVVAMAELSES